MPLLADAAFERDALDFFPTPIADTLDDAAAEVSARAQRDKVVETFRVAIRLLSLLALAGAPGTPAAGGQLAELRRKLLRQGLTDGEWVGLTRETLRPFVAEPERFAVPALVTAFFTRDGKLRGPFDQQGACEKLLTMRKVETVAHGVTGTEEHAVEVLAARLPDFEVFLKSLAWLWNVTLVVPTARQTRPDGTIEYLALRLVGVTPRRGFRPQALALPGEVTLGRVYALVEGKPPLDLYPFVQYAEASAGHPEIFLFEEARKHEVVLRAFPSGETRLDADALVWLRAKFAAPSAVAPEAVAPVGWSLDDLRRAAHKASDDYLDKMQRERVYLPAVYARRFELEAHLSGFLDSRCIKNGMLIVGASGIGKTNTLCHIVRLWREQPNGPLTRDVVLLLGGSTLPGGSFRIQDVILDRLDIPDSFPMFLSAFEVLRKKDEARLIIIVDGIDKHPQPAELLRQLDELIARSESLSWVKIIVSIGEVAYTAIRKAGFVPTIRCYYSIAVQHGGVQRESVEISLGPMTDAELADAYEKYRREPGFSPTSPFDTLSDEVKNAIRNPIFLRIVMEVFNGRRIPRRVLTAEVLLEYCNKKIFSEVSRLFFINRFVDLLLDEHLTAANLDLLTQVPELRQAVLDSSPQSPYLQLLDEQVLEEQLKRVSSILPPQRVVAFTYDRLLEYLVLNRIVEKMGTGAEVIARLSERARTYLPVRGALKMLLFARVDEAAFDEVAALMQTGDPEVMRTIAVELLLELEWIAPTTAGTTDHELASNAVGQLVKAMLAHSTPWTIPVMLEFAHRLQEQGSFRRAQFVYQTLVTSPNAQADPDLMAEIYMGLAFVESVFGDKSGALRDYDTALAFSRAAGNRDREQAILDAIGHVYFDLGLFSRAKEFYEASLAIDRELVASSGGPDALKGEAQSLMNLADCYHRMGELDVAMRSAEQARQLFHEAGDTRMTATALNLIGFLFRRRGLMDNARVNHEQALAIHQKLGDRAGAARDLCYMGLVYQVEGRWDEALALFRKALNVYEEIGDKEEVAYTYNAMGETYRWAGQLGEAMIAYQRAFELYSEIGARRGIAMCLNNLGATELFRGNPQEALSLLAQALALQRELLGVEGEPETLAFLSAAALEVGDLSSALAYSDAGMRVLEQRHFGEEDRQLVYFYRYRIMKGLNRTDEARDALSLAYADVQRQADAISDPQVRRSFVQNFPLRRWIVEAWEGVLSESGGQPHERPG
jgi:tetratricopeptide (TPR) repeat protein